MGKKAVKDIYKIEAKKKLYRKHPITDQLAILLRFDKKKSLEFAHF